MARPKRLGKKYDSFYTKIKDYQKRMLLWTQSNNKQNVKRFSGEYSALTQLRLDIKHKINTHLDGAITFPTILQYGTIRQEFYENTISFKLAVDPDLDDYPALLQQEKDVRKKMEEDTQDFIMEVFNEERIRNLLAVIFFSQYNDGWKKGFEDYRISVAELMLRYSIELLQRHAKQPFLFGQLHNALEIASLIKQQRTN